MASLPQTPKKKGRLEALEKRLSTTPGSSDSSSPFRPAFTGPARGKNLWHLVIVCKLCVNRFWILSRLLKFSERGIHRNQNLHLCLREESKSVVCNPKP